MRIMICASVLFFSCLSNANCPVQQDNVQSIIQLIESTPSCYLAAEMARECSTGDLQDVRTFPVAVRMCMKDFAQLNSNDQAMYDRLLTACGKRNGDLSYQSESLRVHCVLKVAELFSAIRLEDY